MVQLSLEQSRFQKAFAQKALRTDQATTYAYRASDGELKEGKAMDPQACSMPSILPLSSVMAKASSSLLDSRSVTISMVTVSFLMLRVSGLKLGKPLSYSQSDFMYSVDKKLLFSQSMTADKSLVPESVSSISTLKGALPISNATLVTASLPPLRSKSYLKILSVLSALPALFLRLSTNVKAMWTERVFSTWMIPGPLVDLLVEVAFRVTSFSFWRVVPSSFMLKVPFLVRYWFSRSVGTWLSRNWADAWGTSQPRTLANKKNRSSINLMGDKFNPTAFKASVGHMDYVRGQVAEGKNLGDNFSKMKDMFDGMQPALKAQGEHIDNFTSIKSGQNEESKAFENKRQLQRLLELAKIQLHQMLEEGSEWFSLGKKQRKKDQEWEKLRHQVEKHIGVLKSQKDASAIELILKLLNARDFLFKQMLRSLLYRKNLLWRDLNVPMQSYVHGQIKAILNDINNQQEKMGLIPGLPEFQPLSFAEEGRWKILGEQEKAASLPVLWGLVGTHFNELCETIRNYANLNDDPEALKDINKNGKIVRSLRERIQQLTHQNGQLQIKIQELLVSARPDGRAGKDDIKERLEDLEIQLSRKEAEVLQLRSNSLNSVTQIQMLKDKIKALQDQNHHMHMSQLPKLQEMSHAQNSLTELFGKLKKDIDNYATLFSIENEAKKKLAKELQHSQQTIEGLVKMLQKSKIKNKELLQQVQKTDKKCLQVMMARQELLAVVREHDPDYKDVTDP